jgi:hypothetical protein
MPFGWRPSRIVSTMSSASDVMHGSRLTKLRRASFGVGVLARRPILVVLQ